MPFRPVTEPEKLFLPTPEQVARQYIPWFEPVVDLAEIGFHEVAGAGAELVDEEGAAGAEGLGGVFRNHRAEIVRQRRKRQAGQDIVGIFEAELRDDLVHIGGRPVHRDEAAVADGFAQIDDEILVQINDQQGRIGAQAVQHRLAECADPRAIFDKQLGIVPIDRRKHLGDGAVGGRNDRSDHDRMLDKTFEKHAPRAKKTADTGLYARQQRCFGQGG
jgi:hypothetical protein